MKRKLTEEEKKYHDFMFNPDNIKSCDKCPNNLGYDDFQHRLPCGQYRCWIDIFCNTFGEE